MTILPHRYQLQQLQTDSELEMYLDICTSIGQAEAALCLLASPTTMSFQLHSVLAAVSPPTGKCPDQLAWESMNLDYLLIKSGPAIQELADWLDISVKNVLCIPITNNERTLGVIQLINIRNEDSIGILRKQVYLLGKYLVSSYHLLESNRWAGRLQQLLDFIGNISSSLDPDQILRMLLEQVSLLLDAEAASMFLSDEHSGDAILHISSRADHRVVENFRVPPGKGIINHVLATGETIMVNDVHEDKRHFNGLDAISNFETRSILAVALRSQRIELGKQRGSSRGRIVGGLEIMNKMNGDFTQMDVTLAEIFSGQAATILQTAKLYNEMDELFMQLLQSLMNAVDAKDPYTESHSKFVSNYAVTIGTELGLPHETLTQLKLGGMLHDVGKIGIPDTILKKNNTLTRDEYHEIYRHPQIGYKILEKVQLMGRDVLRAILEHHERLDGSGYPLGLRGHEISLVGRIVTVADVFHALTSTRPYRAAKSIETAFQELYDGADLLYDRRCVDALKRAFDKGFIQTEGYKNKSNA
jgi:HD-GYP domain-containing protein (c-di-GMP phosphodiesterase class II)